MQPACPIPYQDGVWSASGFGLVGYQHSGVGLGAELRLHEDDTELIGTLAYHPAILTTITPPLLSKSAEDYQQILRKVKHPVRMCRGNLPRTIWHYYMGISLM